MSNRRRSPKVLETALGASALYGSAEWGSCYIIADLRFVEDAGPVSRSG